MNCHSSTAVAFTGHRSYDGRADRALAAAVAELWQRGFRTFLTGMAVGFDLAAAEAVLRLRDAGAGLTLVCAVPFPGQARRYPSADRLRYDAVLARADRTLVVAPHYRPDCYMRRNDLLVAESSLLLAWYDGSPSGTRYTVRRAQRCGVEVVNLWRDPQRELFPDEP